MTDLTQLSLSQARDGLRNKDFTAQDITAAYMHNIKEAQKLNAFILPTEEKAMEMAKASDAKLQKGEAGLLEGIPHIPHLRSSLG